MIDFEHVWLPQIVQYAELISSGQLEAEWQGRAKATTSVTDRDELHEQVFDDLDAERVWTENRCRTGLPVSATEAIDRFLDALRTVDESDAELVATSPAWKTTKEAAQAVVTNLR
jgi:hypothetical protein